MASIEIIITPVLDLILKLAFFVFFGYFVLLVSYYLILAVIGSLEEKRRMLESREENYPILSSSSFTLPVSVIIPAHNEEEWIADSLGSVLKQNYPELEVIIVNDGSTDNTMAVLGRLLDPEPIDMAYTHKFKDGGVNGFLRSRIHPNVTIMSKISGYKKAGAVNAGLNLAKYKYICVMDADTILEPDALLKIMAEVQKDPDRIIGAGSYFGLVNGFKISGGEIIDRSFSYHPMIAYQNLEYIRSFIGNRIAWSKFNIMPNVPGGFGLWRRDVMASLGGYDKTLSSEDMEYTFRAHDYIVKNKDKDYRILMLPYFAGWTEGPARIKKLIMQRNRWQRTIEETIWKYRHMAFNPKYGGMAFFVMPYYIIYEIFGIFFEVMGLLLLALGLALGSIDLRLFGTVFLFMVLSQGIVSLLSIFATLRGQKFMKTGYVIYLIFLGFTELFWYHWLISFAKISGTYSYARRVSEYDQYEREKRA